MKKLLPTEKKALKEKILDAALHCFNRHGVGKTNVGDIAKQAGISRPLLYQYFNNRRALVDATVDREFETITELFYEQLPQTPTFSESIVESLIVAVKLVKDRPWIEELFENIALSEYPAAMLNPERTFNKTVMGWWLPVFKRARETGELSKKISDEDLLEWISSITYMVIMREGITEERLRYFLSTFVVPALHD